MAGAKPGEEVRHDVVVRAGEEDEGYAGMLQVLLETSQRLPNARPGIVVDARKNMGRTGDGSHPIGDKRLGHLERNRQVRGPIIDSWKNVAMEIDHDSELPVTEVRPRTRLGNRSVDG